MVLGAAAVGWLIGVLVAAAALGGAELDGDAAECVWFVPGPPVVVDATRGLSVPRSPVVATEAPEALAVGLRPAYAAEDKSSAETNDVHVPLHALH